MTQRKLQVYGKPHIDKLPQLQRMSEEQRLAMKTVAEVLPFRVNNYVVEELIDWDNAPDDPMFQLTFPQQGMLKPEDFEIIRGMVQRAASTKEMAPEVKRIQYSLNPHPAGQKMMGQMRRDRQ